MRRNVLVSTDLSGEAIDELKLWLGITRDDEDANLITLLQASLDMCEGFLGQRPLEAQCEELVEYCNGWGPLSSRPISAISSAETLDDTLLRTPLSESDFSTRINADGLGEVKLLSSSKDQVLAVNFTAGIASTWAELPGALRHGIIRLAAFHYRERDGAKTMPPPASVTALWRPWRLARLT